MITVDRGHQTVARRDLGLALVVLGDELDADPEQQRGAESFRYGSRAG